MIRIEKDYNTLMLTEQWMCLADRDGLVDVLCFKDAMS
jgi:hypothetical protein